jgi:dihydrofolate synthase/folylpolyglutamate synthase
MLGAVLQASGYRVGMFTSPHLLSPTERFRINGVPIPQNEYDALIKKTKRLCGPHAHFFEVYTVMAFQCFNEKNVDFAVIETGVGGRLDPTNAVDEPLLTIITAIGLDHQEILGNTIEQIAAEKAGIIKQGRPIVLPKTNLPVLTETARQKNAPAYGVGGCEVTAHRYGLDGTVFSAKLPGASYDRLDLPLLGRHQTDNAAQVLISVQALRNEGVVITDEAVRAGFARVVWRGRFDVCPGTPMVVVDGAHNVSGAECFRGNMELYFPGKPLVIIIGMMKEKDGRRIINALQPLLDRADHIICTQPDNARALPAADLAAQIVNAPSVIPSPSKAFRVAALLTGADAVIAAVGSLYVVSEIIKEVG